MRPYRRTTFITIGCIAALIGLVITKFQHPKYWWLSILLVGLILKRRNIIYLCLAITVGLLLGFWRGEIYSQKLRAIHKLDGRKSTIIVQASQDAVYGKAKQLDFTARSSDVAGNLKISGFGENMIHRGDTVEVGGKLRPGSGSYQAFISYAQLKIISPDSSPINKLTRRLSAGLQSALPEPNASFGAGLLIGQRNNLPEDLYQKMIMVGLVHIVAVSGYNLTILVRSAGRLKLGSKYQQLVLSLILIGSFLLMTGFAASIVRAALVSVLSLWAWFYGRKIRPVLLLMFAAATTALVNPFYIWGDLGWYLSFLAFFGILIVAPALSGRLFRRRPKFLAATALETFCAELMALPFIMMMFGQLSLIGLVANILVVPLVPLAMLLSAVAAIVGMIAPSISGWLAWPANLMLTYMLDIVRWFASLPGIFQKRSLSLATLLVFYSMVGIVLVVFYRRRSPKTAVEKL